MKMIMTMIFFYARSDNAGAVAAAAADSGKTVTIKPEKIVISDNLNHLFRKAEQTFNEPKPLENEIPIPNYESIIKEINKGEIPIELDFFVGGENIVLQNQVMKLGVDKEALELLSYLQTNHCTDIMRENKIKMHIETDYIFFIMEIPMRVSMTFFMSSWAQPKK